MTIPEPGTVTAQLQAASRPRAGGMDVVAVTNALGRLLAARGCAGMYAHADRRLRLAVLSLPGVTVWIDGPGRLLFWHAERDIRWPVDWGLADAATAIAARAGGRRADRTPAPAARA